MTSTLQSLTNLDSLFCTLKMMFEDSPTLISVLSGENSVNLTLGAPGELGADMEKTKIATITATARAAINITLKSNLDQNCRG